MARRVLRAAVAGGLALLCLAAGASAQHPANALANCSVSDASLDGEEQALLGLINGYRAANGLGALGPADDLNRDAAWTVSDLAGRTTFSHVDSLGRSPYERAVDCGHAGGAGENLAAGGDWATAQQAFNAWKASPGHNANLLANYYHQIGIARLYRAGSTYGWYWATEFGTNVQPSASQLQPAATPAPSTEPAAATTPATPASPSPAAAPPSTAATAPAPQPRADVPASAGAQAQVNVVRWSGPDSSPEEAFAATLDRMAAVYSYDDVAGSWQLFGPGLPSFLNTMRRVFEGETYWVLLKQ
jgi:uncharacterized protein YkwD